MSECIFCKIIDSSLPCFKIYEDDFVLAFLDITPVKKGHILVIPKQHFANFEEIDQTSLANVYKCVKKIGLALKKTSFAEGYNVQVNNDPVAGQIIPHFHVHIIPRTKNDGLALWPGNSYNEGRALEYQNEIKNNL